MVKKTRNWSTETLSGIEIAERRISSWIGGKIHQWATWDSGGTYPLRRSDVFVLDLRSLGLRSVPELLRELYIPQSHNLSFAPTMVLDLAFNKIFELPDWFAELRMSVINLTGNRLLTLPENIGVSKVTHLVLEENQLVLLPEPFRTLPRLQYLGLRGNDGLDIPESVLEANEPDQILSYYFESRGEYGQPLLELKLLFVGRGKAGKTTLVKRLAGEEPDVSESETHSIAIRELDLELAPALVRTRIWDFGGQEILHSTHRFFLTERSLYVLVLEPRTNLAQHDAEYWLKMIESQCGGSPVIVVMNWSSGHCWKVDEVKLRRKFPFIVDFVSVDALHGDGIDNLLSTIINTVKERMPDVWLPFPLRWRAIKDHVAGMSDNYLTYDRYAELCIEYGETDPDAQATLAGILHALGLALYFGKDPRLHDTRVLNPAWVTGGVYAVIRSPSVKENKGHLTLSDMPRVLREAEEKNVIEAENYPPETHPFILELMRAFQLCFASDEEEELAVPTPYLVPTLLPDFEPEMAEEWEQAPIRLRYNYDVLPPGLLPHFIVRAHALSEGAPRWRHGVVLRHGKASALVREESDRPEMNVFVLGGDEETRRVLVTMVRRELEALHREMKMAPVEELELTGASESWIGVKALREIEKPGTPAQRLPVRPDGTAEVNVSAELDKLEPAESRAADRDRNAAPAPIRIFVSYAREDERQLPRLDATLGVLEQHHGLVPWRDKRLLAGDEWDDEIRRRLEEMDIFLFIASQRSLVSPYIRDNELKRARERREVGEVEIVTVKLEPCAADEDPILGKLQRLAPKYGSIAETSPRSLAWEQVRKDLLPVIERVREKKATAAKH